jgi:hypothetical protein
LFGKIIKKKNETKLRERNRGKLVIMSDSKSIMNEENVVMRCGRLCCMVANCSETATKQIADTDFCDYYCDDCFKKELEKIANNTYKKRGLLLGKK